MMFSKALCQLMFPAALAVSGIALAPQHAAAQTTQFCSNRLVADAMYSTVTSNGRTARIDYFAQLRNTTNSPLTYMLQFVYHEKPMTDRASGAPRVLPAYQSERLKLGSLMVDNPAGTGRLTDAEARKFVMVNCR